MGVSSSPSKIFVRIVGWRHTTTVGQWRWKLVWVSTIIQAPLWLKFKSLRIQIPKLWPVQRLLVSAVILPTILVNTRFFNILMLVFENISPNFKNICNFKLYFVICSSCFLVKMVCLLVDLLIKIKPPVLLRKRQSREIFVLKKPLWPATERRRLCHFSVDSQRIS